MTTPSPKTLAPRIIARPPDARRWVREALATPYARALAEELGPNWHAPLPPNPTVEEELAAWEADHAKLERAKRIIALRREIEDLQRAVRCDGLSSEDRRAAR